MRDRKSAGHQTSNCLRLPSVIPPRESASSFFCSEPRRMKIAGAIRTRPWSGNGEYLQEKSLLNSTLHGFFGGIMRRIIGSSRKSFLFCKAVWRALPGSLARAVHAGFESKLPRSTAQRRQLGQGQQMAESRYDPLHRQHSVLSPEPVPDSGARRVAYDQ